LANHKAGDIVSMREGKGYLSRVDGEEVALFRVGNDFFAVRNLCPHQHFSMLHQGEVKDCVVTCPMHGWSFDLRTGLSTNASGRLKMYPVEVKDGSVYIQTNGNADSENQGESPRARL